VHFGKIDSDRYRRFCSQFNITTLPYFLYYPIGKSYTANQPTVQGDSAMVDYFNKLLGTQREIDGRISDRFGLERNITRQLDRFMNVRIYETSKRQGDRSMKESVMEDVRNHMKEYKNAKLYLHIMKHVMSEGKGFLKEEKAKRTKLVREVGVFSRKYPMNKVYLNILNTFMKYDFSGLVALTGDNFDKIVNGKRNVLCVFYKKDCETCEAFKKEYIS
jgi:singapore isolate B (sub-type 7) whole genome shotgun sequence assembly, scaffold_2